MCYIMYCVPSVEYKYRQLFLSSVVLGRSLKHHSYFCPRFSAIGVQLPTCSPLPGSQISGENAGGSLQPSGMRTQSFIMSMKSLWVLLMCLQILKECLSLASFAFNKCSYGYMLTCFRKEFNFYISCLSWELPLPHSSSSNTTKEVVSAFSIFWVVFQIILLKGQKLQWCVIVLEFILILRWQYWVDKVLHQQCYW